MKTPRVRVNPIKNASTDLARTESSDARFSKNLSFSPFALSLVEGLRGFCVLLNFKQSARSEFLGVHSSLFGRLVLHRPHRRSRKAHRGTSERRHRRLHVHTIAGKTAFLGTICNPRRGPLVRTTGQRLEPEKEGSIDARRLEGSVPPCARESLAADS